MKTKIFPQKMKKMWIIVSILLLFCIFFLIYQNWDDKTMKIGNTKGNDSIEEIESNLFGMNSYQATIEVTVKSNKNENTYTLKQEYRNQKGEVFAKQEVMMPENLKGVEICKKNDQLEVRNTTLNLQTIYEKYEGITKNTLWLDEFLEEYRNSEEKLRREENEAWVYEIKDSKNRYRQKKMLFVSKTNGKPQKLVIQDNNQKNTVYILYKEIEISRIKEK